MNNKKGEILRVILCIVVVAIIFATAGIATGNNEPMSSNLVVEATLRASGSGTAYAATVNILEAWDVNHVAVGINTDPSIGGFWLRHAEDGIIRNYNLGTADTEYHTYRIEYDGSAANVYIDGVLKRTVSINLTNIKLILHANARAIGDSVSAQFDDIVVSNEVIFTDNFNDGIIDPKWSTYGEYWMSVTEQGGVLDMSGTTSEQYWVGGGVATLIIDELKPLYVTIDIKPGSDPNSINLSSAGVIPVAILSSDTFDATTVIPESVALAGARVKLVGKAGKYLCHDEHINEDGLLDLVCQVQTIEDFIVTGESVAVLEAETIGGKAIRGEDGVNIVPDN
jgi:hypothetical protein